MPKTKDWQRRVVLERFELSAKVRDLMAFLKKANIALKVDELFRLEHQLNFMVGYLAILDSRIHHFTKE